MSPGGSSERIAFLRREIARVESRDGMAEATARRPPGAAGGRAPVSALLSAARLAADLHEIVPASPPDVFAAMGFVFRLCAVCARERPGAGVVLAIEDFVARETGAPYGPGLAEAGVDPANLVIVRTHGPRETLRAMEDALKCPGVAVVVAESAIEPRLYSLDVSRRLALAARAGGGAGFLTPIAFAGNGERLSSAAATRVEIARRSSAAETPSPTRPGKVQFNLPGAPIVGVRILKARGAFGMDAGRVHEVACNAFSFGEPSLPADRPDQAAGFRAMRSA